MYFEMPSLDEIYRLGLSLVIAGRESCDGVRVRFFFFFFSVSSVSTSVKLLGECKRSWTLSSTTILAKLIEKKYLAGTWSKLGRGWPKKNNTIFQVHSM